MRFVQEEHAGARQAAICYVYLWKLSGLLRFSAGERSEIFFFGLTVQSLWRTKLFKIQAAAVTDCIAKELCSDGECWGLLYLKCTGK